MKFHKEILHIDCEALTSEICSFIKQQTVAMKRDGVVIGLSGGIDSALCAQLCVKALGKEKVLGLVLPEKESSPISKEYALSHARKLDIRTEIIDITTNLDCFGVYEKRDETIKAILPEYNSCYKIKITLPSGLLSRDAYNFYTLKVEDSVGNVKSVRLNIQSIRRIMAATNIKQRTRMMYLYYFAEQNNYFVCGTTNRNETLQGYFVKYGDGGVDIEPIAQLYKVQVYQLAYQMGVIKEIIDRAPSPDTFSFEVTDEEFYFRIPYDKLDLLLYAWENGIAVSEVCKVMGLSEEQVARVFRDFASKHKATEHLRTLPPTLLSDGNNSLIGISEDKPH